MEESDERTTTTRIGLHPSLPLYALHACTQLFTKDPDVPGDEGKVIAGDHVDVHLAGHRAPSKVVLPR